MWLQNDMNVVRHDDPGEEFVTAPHVLSMEKRFDKGRCDLWILQPARAAPGTVQLQIVRQECFPRVGILHQKCRWGLRKRSSQSPCEKHYGVVRDPVRKSSLPEH